MWTLIPDVERLRIERLLFKEQMNKAIACKTKKQKIKLAATWKNAYSEMTYTALIDLARNHQARLKVADWDLEHFEIKKQNGHR
jgi:uncharacterized iron-regulated protein